MTGNALPLSQKESAYEFGYASLIVTGAQRIAPKPGGSVAPEHLAVLELLISRGLPLSVPDIGGYTALHHCVLLTSEMHSSFDKVTKEKVIRKLLTSGADISYQNRWGDTPLHYAVHRGDTLGIDLLMEYGADIDTASGNRVTVRDMHIPAGATVAAAMEKWLLKRSGKEKALMTGKCCDQPATNSCEIARVVLQCSIALANVNVSTRSPRPYISLTPSL